jgi:CrcB protein
MKNILFVALGGAVGSALRYLSFTAGVKFFNAGAAAGTFFVNAVGSYLIGFLYIMLGAEKMPEHIKILLFTGILGGFTTFSAFSFEFFAFVKEGKFSHALGYVAAQVIICLALVCLGYVTAIKFIHR